MKSLILIGGFLIVFVVAAGIMFYGVSLTGKIIEETASEREYDYEYTKAFCEGTTCQDFAVKCKDGEVLDVSPITGQVVFDDGWEDPRVEDEKDLCDRS